MLIITHLKYIEKKITDTTNEPSAADAAAAQDAAEEPAAVSEDATNEPVAADTAAAPAAAEEPAAEKEVEDADAKAAVEQFMEILLSGSETADGTAADGEVTGEEYTKGEQALMQFLDILLSGYSGEIEESDEIAEELLQDPEVEETLDALGVMLHELLGHLEEAFGN